MNQSKLLLFFLLPPLLLLLLLRLLLLLGSLMSLLLRAAVEVVVLPRKYCSPRYWPCPGSITDRSPGIGTLDIGLLHALEPNVLSFAWALLFSGSSYSGGCCGTN